MKEANYIYTSERLGYRQWSMSDLDWFADLCANPEVMRHFPNTLDRSQSEALIKRLISLYETHGYTYYATETLDDQRPIGFVGVAYQDYLNDQAPWQDIGWRLHPDYWGLGLATEGARACLQYCQSALSINQVKAVAPLTNLPSINIMKKIGMQYVKTFKHPKLKDYPKLEECVMYGVGI